MITVTRRELVVESLIAGALWRLLGRLVYEVSVASLVFRGFPRYKVGVSYALMGVTVLGVWAIEVSAMDKSGGGLPDWVPTLDPTVGLAIGYSLLLTSVGMRFHRRGPRIAIAFAIYAAIALLVGMIYCAAFLNRSLWVLEGTDLRPSGTLPLSQHLSFLSYGEGIPSPPFVLQGVTLMLAASSFPRPLISSPPHAAIGIASATAFLLTGASLLVDGGQRWVDVLLAIGTGAMLFNVTLSLSFGVRSAIYSRAIADSLAAVVAFHLFLFFYAPSHPALMLSGASAALGLVFVCLAVTHPRRFSQPRAEEVGG